MRPESLSTAFGNAFHKGFRAASQNLLPMLVLEGVMATMVAIYYCWPAGAVVLSAYATWQHSGGILLSALATAVAGGLLSELSLIYFRDKGRWSASHIENIVFKMALFFGSGMAVYEFYIWQAVWFGDGNSWSVLLPKILVDQFVYTVFWANPYATLLFRWQTLGYSGQRLWQELDLNFLLDRMLPVLVTNWMFWIPGVTLLYSMPLLLQTPLFVLATAIWGLLLPAVAKTEQVEKVQVVSSGPAILPNAAE